MLKQILYISYDGMTDPLGQSQIIPYLQGLSQYGYSFTILSFEKKERYPKLREHILSLLEPYGIKWVPLSFTRKPPMLSKLYDMVRMKRTAFRLHSEHHFDMVHCRGYLGADVGLALKTKKGVKLFFDMRGFWADEKKDGGAWDLNHPLYKRVYQYYKKKEALYLKNADFIISLTHAGKTEMEKWDYYDPKIPISVIPCCADMKHFALVKNGQKEKAKELLKIQPGRLVLSYLGSVGAWYMLDEMLEMFRYISEAYPNALFLFVTPSSADMILERAAQHGLPKDAFIIREASRKEVPEFIAASDINISFIKPVYSKISSSPTKLGEVLSMGIPVISNAGVGDVEQIVRDTSSGLVMHEFTVEAYRELVRQIPDLLKLDPERIREKAATIYDLEKGVEQYRQAYQKVLG